MAEFTAHPHHPLYYWCLPQMALYVQSAKNHVPPANMTRMKENRSLSPYAGMSILTMLKKIGLHLWEAMKKVIHHCVNVTELLNSTTFLMCARDIMSMTGESEKSTVGLEAQERPRLKSRNMELQPASLCNIIGLGAQMKIMEDPMKKSDAFPGDGDEVVLADWLEWESDEEEEDEEGCDDDGSSDNDDYDEGKEEQSSLDKEDEAEWTDEEESNWSDDEEDSEASTESTELWEFFLNNDPYNPLYFSCPTGVKTKPADKTQLQNHTTSNPIKVKRSTSGNVEEHSSKENTKEGTKKVRFSDEIIVHNLVAWTFASREARNGSCWLQLARDRERFRRRVEKTGEVLSPCLTSQHRARVCDRLQRETQPELC